MECSQISKIMEYYKLNAGNFAVAIGVTPATISNIRNGRNKPTLEIVNKIMAKFPEINLNWLILGTGDMLAKQNNLVDRRSSKIFTSDSNPIMGTLFDIEENKTHEKSNIKPVGNKKQEQEDTLNETEKGMKYLQNDKEQPTRKVEKIIIYYSDKTYDEFNIG